MPSSVTLPPSPVRINYLDSVRGLAALAVVFYHFIGWRWADTLVLPSLLLLRHSRLHHRLAPARPAPVPAG